jgi:hypothetical protein
MSEISEILPSLARSEQMRVATVPTIETMFDRAYEMTKAVDYRYSRGEDGTMQRGEVRKVHLTVDGKEMVDSYSKHVSNMSLDQMIAEYDRLQLEVESRQFVEQPDNPDELILNRALDPFEKHLARSLKGVIETCLRYRVQDVMQQRYAQEGFDSYASFLTSLKNTDQNGTQDQQYVTWAVKFSEQGIDYVPPKPVVPDRQQSWRLTRRQAIPAILGLAVGTGLAAYKLKDMLFEETIAPSPARAATMRGEARIASVAKADVGPVEAPAPLAPTPREVETSTVEPGVPAVTEEPVTTPEVAEYRPIMCGNILLEQRKDEIFAPEVACTVRNVVINGQVQLIDNQDTFQFRFQPRVFRGDDAELSPTRAGEFIKLTLQPDGQYKTTVERMYHTSDRTGYDTVVTDQAGQRMIEQHSRTSEFQDGYKSDQPGELIRLLVDGTVDDTSYRTAEEMTSVVDQLSGQLIYKQQERDGKRYDQPVLMVLERIRPSIVTEFYHRMNTSNPDQWMTFRGLVNAERQAKGRKALPDACPDELFGRICSNRVDSEAFEEKYRVNHPQLVHWEQANIVAQYIPLSTEQAQRFEAMKQEKVRQGSYLSYEEIDAFRQEIAANSL